MRRVFEVPLIVGVRIFEKLVGGSFVEIWSTSRIVVEKFLCEGTGIFDERTLSTLSVFDGIFFANGFEKIVVGPNGLHHKFEGRLRVGLGELCFPVQFSSLFLDALESLHFT